MKEILFTNCNILNTKKKEFFLGNILIKDDKIIGVNVSEDSNYEIVDLSGKYVTPGFIDGHIHLESSIVSPYEFSKMVSMHGTTAVITDPHEIGNVCGVNGINWMIKSTENLPIDVYFMVPSCVPATPFDESAYTVDSDMIKSIFDSNNKRILGLAEVMNYPGVINGDAEVLKKIEYAKEKNLIVDGHAPMLSGEDLVKYISAGIMSCHECSSLSEAKEKLDVAKRLNQKFYIMIREGTAAKNLEALVDLMKDSKYYDNVTFATDDKHPEEILLNGHIDNAIRKAIKLGVKPEVAYTVASYNASEYFNLSNIGSIEVGMDASMVVLSDINNCVIDKVIKNGVILNEDIINNWPKNVIPYELDNDVRDAINMSKIDSNMIKDNGNRPVIGLIPHEIITKKCGYADKVDIENDIIKVVVIEPHKGTMHMSVAYLSGTGIKEGAIGTTVSHDSHYMILAGVDDSDIVMAANRLRELHGGKIVVKNGEVISELALPIANLMTDEDVNNVIDKLKKMKESVKVNKGIDLFMNLSFVSLAVIPDVRLLPGGVFSVNEWKFI